MQELVLKISVSRLSQCEVCKRGENESVFIKMSWYFSILRISVFSWKTCPWQRVRRCRACILRTQVTGVGTPLRSWLCVKWLLSGWRWCSLKRPRRQPVSFTVTAVGSARLHGEGPGGGFCLFSGVGLLAWASCWEEQRQSHADLVQMLTLWSDFGPRRNDLSPESLSSFCVRTPLPDGFVRRAVKYIDLPSAGDVVNTF